MNTIEAFFKPQNMNTAKSDLMFRGANGNLRYERIYCEYYNTLWNTYKARVPIELGEKKAIGKSTWEPLLKAGHDSFAIVLHSWLPLFNTPSEMGKLMGCFEVLNLHGFGIFELGIAPKDTFLKITVANSLEDAAFDLLEDKPDNPVCAFTAGMVLACYNLSMTTLDISATNSPIDGEMLQKLYMESPDIVQVEYGSVTREESHFTLSARS